jgi:hypothetical protein
MAILQARLDQLYQAALASGNHGAGLSTMIAAARIVQL